MTAVIEVLSDGNAHCLHTDIISLQSLGRPTRIGFMRLLGRRTERQTNDTTRNRRKIRSETGLQVRNTKRLPLLRKLMGSSATAKK